MALKPEGLCRMILLSGIDIFLDPLMSVQEQANIPEKAFNTRSFRETTT